MSIDILYPQIIEKLILQLRELRDSENRSVFKVVYLGKQAAPEDFPCILILPGMIRLSPVTTKEDEYRIYFELHGISASSEREGGLKDAVWRINLVSKMLTEDREFGDLVDNLEVESIDPEVERPRVRTRHEASLLVRFEKKM